MFIPPGPLWNLRHHYPPSVRKKLVTIVEQRQTPLLGQFVSELIRCVGRENIRIKPHPYKMLRGESQAVLEFPEFCETTPFWEEVPELAISLGSTSSQELIHLGVPEVTLVHSDHSPERFPSVGQFPFSSEGTESALIRVKDLLGNPENRLNFLRAQQEEISDLRDDAEKALGRIIGYVVREATR